jgi:hypothetical protein
MPPGAKKGRRRKEENGGGKRQKPDWRKYLYNHDGPGRLQIFLTGSGKTVML